MSDMDLRNVDSIDKLIESVEHIAAKINAHDRREMGKLITQFTTSYATNNTYFESIPLDKMTEALKEYGVVVLDDDNTPLTDYMLMGEDSYATFPLGVETESGTVEVIDNAGLALQWYRMPSGRYEINAYIS